MSDDDGIRKIGPGESADKPSPATLIAESFTDLSPLIPNRDIKIAISRGYWILVLHKEGGTTNAYLTFLANPSMPLLANFGMEESADGRSYYHILKQGEREVIMDDLESYEKASVLHNGIMFLVTENEKDYIGAKEAFDDLHRRLEGETKPPDEGVPSIVRDVDFNTFFNHDRRIVFEYGICTVRRNGPEAIFEIQDNSAYPGDRNDVTFIWNTEALTLEYRKIDAARTFYISTNTDAPFLAQDTDFSSFVRYIGIMNSVLTRQSEWVDLQ